MLWFSVKLVQEEKPDLCILRASLSFDPTNSFLILCPQTMPPPFSPSDTSFWYKRSIYILKQDETYYNGEFSLREISFIQGQKKVVSPGWCGSVVECQPENQRVASLNPSPRTHAWVVGQVPSRGCARDSHTLILLSLSFSLHPPL